MENNDRVFNLEREADGPRRRRQSIKNLRAQIAALVADITVKDAQLRGDVHNDIDPLDFRNADRNATAIGRLFAA